MQLVDMEDRVVEWTRVVTTVLPSAQTLSRPEDGKGSSINESCCLFVFADRLNAVPLLCRLNCRRFGAPLLLDKLHQYAEQFAWRQEHGPLPPARNNQCALVSCASQTVVNGSRISPPCVTHRLPKASTSTKHRHKHVAVLKRICLALCLHAISVARSVPRSHRMGKNVATRGTECRVILPVRHVKALRSSLLQQLPLMPPGRGAVVILSFAPLNMIGVCDWKGYRLLVEQVIRMARLDALLAWFSTLGGAHSALGDCGLPKHAIQAEAVSRHQMSLAVKVGDPGLISRCVLFLALSFLQQRRVSEANELIGWQYCCIQNMQRLREDTKLLALFSSAVNRLQAVKASLKIS